MGEALRMADQYQIEITKLREENELLRAENFALNQRLRTPRPDILMNALNLSRREAQVLTALYVAAPSKIVNRDEIYFDVWAESEGNAQIVDVYLSKLRKKLTGTWFAADLFQTFWGSGYSLTMDARLAIQKIFEEAA